MAQHYSYPMRKALTTCRQFMKQFFSQKNKVVVEEARLKLAASSFKYKVVDSNHIYVLEHTVFSEDGVLVLEQNEGSVQKLSDADELIAELEEFSLNSEV